MKTLLCQINTTPNDFDGNCQQIVQGFREGWKRGADLIVFPELSIPGYLCKDMMFRRGFVEENLKHLDALIAHIPLEYNPHIILGYIDKNYSGEGKPFRNMAAVIHNRHVVATYQKQLLPFYDVFDEGRYFQPGTERTIVEIGGKKYGICICEDLWNDKGIDDYNYKFNPVEAYRVRGIYDIISINSSPFVRHKPYNRIKMVKEITGEVGSVIYCNQIGGQDELVFDGNSFVINKGKVCAAAGSDPYLFYDDENKHELDRWASYVNDTAYNMLKLGLKDYIQKSKFKQVVVGSSGGIDSALVLSLACDAIGPENVHGIRMPSTISSDHSKNDAEQLHKNLGCHDHLVPIDHNPFVNQILFNLGRTDPKPIANENIQARLRGLVLMYYSNAFDALLLSTGNKTELALGYCTLYGDMNGGFCPINDLYKMQVYEMARSYNDYRWHNIHPDERVGKVKHVIPENILTKAPSAELAPGQTDEASLLPYPVLDTIVQGYIEHFIGDFKSFQTYCFGAQHFAACRGASIKELMDGPNQKTKEADVLCEWFKTPTAQQEYERMIRLININEFKRRQAAPGIKITPVAFGIGRRLPIVKG